MPSCSTCLPVVGFAQNCQLKQPGGFQPYLLMIPACQIEEYTAAGYDPSIIASFTLKAGAAWFRVQAVKDSIQANAPIIGAQRMVNCNVQWNIQNYGNGVDYIEAASAHKEFFDGLLDSIEPMVFINYDRRGVGRVYGVGAGMAFGLEQQDSDGIQFGAAQTDPSVTTFIFQGLLDGAPFVLADGISLPEA